MEDTQKRQVARKVRISEILGGTYVKGEGWEPNYVLTDSGTRISRLNLIAAVVSLLPGVPNSSFLLDDGSGTIGLRPFEEMASLKGVELGDIINVIGKPREYGAERYVVPEIVRKVKADGWVRVRQKELEITGGNAEKAAAPQVQAAAETVVESIAPTTENSFQKIYRLIKKLDSGDGASIEDVIGAAGLHNTEEIIGELLKEGEIFEIKSGRLKVLE